MITVSSDWKAIQRAIVRPEGYVKIIATGVEITKRNIKTFRYTQSGKIDNSIIPTGTIYVEILKSSTLNYDLDTSLVYQLQFGFDINGTPEMINVGYFMIKGKEIPANGLVAKYTFSGDFTAQGQQSADVPPKFFLDETYKGGSNGSGSGRTARTQEYFTFLTLFERLGGFIVDLDYPPQISKGLDVCSYGEALQQCALVYGGTLVCRPRQTAQRYYIVDVFEKSLSDYIIGSKVQYDKPEVEQGKSIQKYVVVGEVLTYQRATSGYTFNNYSTEVAITGGAEYKCEVKANELYGAVSNSSPNYFAYLYENEVRIKNLTDQPLYVDSVHFYKMTLQRNIKREYVVDNNGEEVITVSSRLIGQNTNACGNYLLGCGNLRDIVKVSCRIDPRIELFDIISIQLPDGNYAKGYVEDFTIEFNGSFNGEVSIRVDEYGDITKLGTPTITNSGNVITITPVANATNYQIYLNGNYIATTNQTTFDLTDYMYSGSNSVMVKATATSYLDSDFSNTVVIATPLDTPVISISGTVLSITCDPNATSNIIYVNGSSYYTLEGSSMNLTTLGLSAGSYTIKVISQANGYYDSGFSNELTYVVPLSTPTISITNTSTLNITPVSLATSYDIYVDNIFARNITETTYNLTLLSLSAGYHTIKVKALASGYTSSDYSNELSYQTQLAKPTISISGDVLTISAVPNASTYDIYVNNLLIDTISTTTYTFSGYTTGNYNVKVQAKGTNYIDSEYSDTAIYRVALTTPAISISQDTLTITTTSPLADAYKIYVDNVYQASFLSNQTTYDLTQLNLPVGSDYVVKVQAVANLYVESGMSNSQTYIGVLEEPTITQPLILNETLDGYVDDRSTSVEVVVDNVVIGEVNV